MQFPRDHIYWHKTLHYKKGSHSNINNYRPVSLLPCVSKIFEKLVFNHILNYLRLNSVTTAKQSDFIPGVSQLLHISHKIYQELDKNNSVRAVFLDFTKAFDKVSLKVCYINLIAAV